MLVRWIVTLLFFYTTTAQANYLMDMLIIEHQNSSAWEEEFWPSLPAKLDSEDRDIAILPSLAGNGWRWSSGGGQIASVERRLSGSSEYRVVGRYSWQLPAETKEQAHTGVITASHPATGLPVQVRVKLFKQKFEHIQIEAQMEKKIPAGVRIPFAQKHKLNPDTLEDQWRFLLQESRKIKPGELQYFDHPQFGIILVVTGAGAAS